MAKAKKDLGDPKPPSADAGAAGTHGLQELAKLLEITPQYFLVLVRKGFIPRVDRGKYNLVGAVRGYIRFLRDEERRSSKSAAHSRIQDARAREVERRIAREDRLSIETAEAQAVLDDIVGIYRSEYAGLPAGCTRDVEQQKIIETYVDKTQTKVETVLRERFAALRAGGGAVEAVDEE